MFVGATFDVDYFVIDLCFGPCTEDAVFVRGGGIETFDVQILYIRSVVREAPGDAVIVSDDYERRTGQGKSLYVPTWGGGMDLVPDWRKPEFQVGVVR